MYKPTRRHLVYALLLCAALGMAGVWVLLHPASIWVQPWRAAQTTAENDVMFGPYPVEADFVALKGKGVTTIISLLDSNIPYEKVLLAQERERAARHGMQVLNFPMASILGQSFGRDYQQNSRAAARAALDADGTAYIHCYLGLHRAKNVQAYLDTVGSSVTYTGVRSESAEDVLAENRAKEFFQAREYPEALAELAKISVKGIRASRLEAWIHYRQRQIGPARAGFERVLREDPQDQESLVGLAYCALSEHRYAEAAEHFSLVLARDPDHPDATEGLAHTRYRQHDLAAARALFERAVALNPENTETRQMLQRLDAMPAAMPAAAASAIN